MASNKIQIGLMAYKNNNRKSAGYGKYYLKVNPSKTLSTGGFIRHILGHNTPVPQAILEATLMQVSACLRELLLQGIPVKIDGFGTFTPYFRSKGEQNIDDVGTPSSLRSKIEGLHFRLIPDGTEWDNTQSTKNLLKASLKFDGWPISVGGLGNTEMFIADKGLQ